MMCFGAKCVSSLRKQSCFDYLKKKSINIPSVSARLEPIKLTNKTSSSPFIRSRTSISFSRQRCICQNQEMKTQRIVVGFFFLDHMKRVGFPWHSLSATCVLIRVQERGPLFKGEDGWLWGRRGLWHPFKRDFLQVFRLISGMLTYSHWGGDTTKQTKHADTLPPFLTPIYHSCGVGVAVGGEKKRHPEA